MTQTNWNAGGGADEDVQMPLGTGGDSGVGEYTPMESKPKIGGSTLALIGAFGLALALLYGLGVHGKPRKASAESLAHQQQVQSAITELLEKNGKAQQIKGLFRDTDRLVAMFYSYLGTNNTDRRALPHDPFANDESHASLVRATSVNEARDLVAENAAAAEKLRKVAETFDTLRLQSVMLGKVPVAMISNQMVTIGAKVGEFTVADIQPKRVILTYIAGKDELKLARSGGAAGR